MGQNSSCTDHKNGCAAGVGHQIRSGLPAGPATGKAGKQRPTCSELSFAALWSTGWVPLPLQDLGALFLVSAPTAAQPLWPSLRSPSEN